MNTLNRNAVSLTINIPDSYSVNDAIALADQLITQAQGCTVTASSTGISQAVAEQLQQAHPSLQLSPQTV